MTSLVAPAPRTRTTPGPAAFGRRAGPRELGVLVGVYVGYAVSRVQADDALSPATTRAARILDLERMLHLDVEAGLNRWLLEHDAVGVVAAFHHASAHYLLAAFPSMHAGWALWVALAVSRVSRRVVVMGLGWTHALVTAVVVVGTGNHWVLDVVAGWAVVLITWRTLGPREGSTDRPTDGPTVRPTWGERTVLTPAGA